MRGEVYINGLDAWSYYGVVLDEGSEEALLLPSPLKSFTSNDMRSHHGKQVFKNNPRLKDRTVSLTFCFVWAEDYMEKYNRFVDMLQQGTVVLSTKIMGTKMTFNLVYNSCRKYTSIQYAGKLIVNFEEPNPANRLTGNPIDIFAPKIAALGGDSNNTIQTYKQLDPLIKNDAVTILFPTVIESGVVYGMNNISGDIVRFPFSRNSQASYFDKDNTMQIVEANIPRIDYGNYGSSAKILIEKAGTNIVKNSGAKLDISTPITNYLLRSYYADVSDLTTDEKGIMTLSLNVYEGFNARLWFAKFYHSGEELKTGNTESIIGEINGAFSSEFISSLSTSLYNYDYMSSNEQRLSNKFIINWIDIKKGTERTSYMPTPTDASATRAVDKLSYFIFGDCSVYLKTTKQNIVLDKSTGLWNIESDLNNEGIITLAIFDRILTTTEKAQLTQTK